MSKVEWWTLDLLDHYNFTLDSPQGRAVANERVGSNVGTILDCGDLPSRSDRF